MDGGMTRAGRLLDRLARRVSRPLPLPVAPAPETLRVMTYNTHHGAGRDNVHDVEAVARTIERCRPDVVALQEVDRHWGQRSGWLDQPAWYAERLGMEMHYAAILEREPESGRADVAQYGLAILSRLPLTAPDHRLYTGPAAESRGLVIALVRSPAPGPRATRTLRLINTHLSVRNRRQRRQQLEELLSYADSDSDLPTIVAGDFNALARARALRAVRRQYRDAWEVGRGSPATVFARRIDYLWLSRQLRPLQTVVVRSRASDHSAVVSDLAWV